MRSPWPNGPRSPSRANTVRPVARDEHVDEHDRHATRSPPCAARARSAAADARAGARAEHREQQREQRERVVEQQRRAPSARAPTARRRPRARRAAGWRGGGRRAACGLIASCAASGSAQRARRRDRHGEAVVRAWRCRRRAPRASTPAASVPVTTHTGASSPWRVAAISPAPAPSVRTARPSASSSVSVAPSAAKRA